MAQRQAAQPVEDLHRPVRVSTLGQLLQAGKQGCPCAEMSESDVDAGAADWQTGHAADHMAHHAWHTFSEHASECLP